MVTPKLRPASSRSLRRGTLRGTWGFGSRPTARGATVLADAVPHPAQLDRPDWDFAFDDDPVESTKTRAALVHQLVRGDDHVVCGHFPGTGIGRIASRDGRTVWEESS
jgi:glyoxylase-like metal-dependent hydrolase (beta-lactamase superfamily II)